MILLDTDVMIDLLRRHPPAMVWIESVRREAIGLPGLVVMELLQGCRSSDEQHHLEAKVRPFVLHWPDRADCARALTDFSAFWLSHHLGLLDSLIAETAVGLGAEMATFNVKHYRVVRALRCFQPYER